MNIVPVVIFCLAVLLYLFLLCPKVSRRAKLVPFSKQYIAHRGMWDERTPENTMAAFEKAAKQKFGIELDVRLTKDGEVVVFHDDDLVRAAGDTRRVDETTWEELSKVRLFGSQERVPRFSDVLKQVKGRVPLIVELKMQKNGRELCEKTAALLDGYAGEFCIESFSPLMVFWFRVHRKNVIRGVLVTNFSAEEVPVNFAARFILSNLLTNFLAYPDFLALDVRYRKQVSQFVCRYLFQPVTVFWTVKNEEVLTEVQDQGDIFIFDSFVPEREPRTMVVKSGRNMKLD